MNITECPVCYHEFDRPLQLSCGHTVCAGCADKLKINSEQQVVVDRGLAAEPRAGMLRLYDELQLHQQHHLRHLQHLQRLHHSQQYLAGIIEGRGSNTQQGWHGQGYNDLPPNFGMGMGPMWMQLMWMPPGLQPPFPPREHGLDHPHRAVRATLPQRVTKIRCPECRSMTEVPAGGLPVNYRLKEMIERMKKEKDAETSLSQSAFAMICSECDKEVEKGVYFVCGACPEKAQICSLCIVRLHLSHNGQIVERKAPTEQDSM